MAGTGTVTTLATDNNSPNGVAVDALGNVYYSAYNNPSIIELPVGGSNPISIGSGYINVFDVAVGKSGTVYVADGINNTINAVYKTGGYSVNPALPPGLAIDVNSGIISGAPAAANAAKSYTISAVNNSGTGTAAVSIAVTALNKPVISYSTPQTYVVNSVISALAPTNTGGSVAVEPPVALANVNNNAGAIALDGSGNIYTAGFNTGDIQKIAAGSRIGVTLGSGFQQMTGMVADAAGNIYVALEASGSIVKIPVSGGAAVIVASGLSYLTALAIDAGGNLYFAENTSFGYVRKIVAGSSTPVIVAYGTGYTLTLAVDASGNVYFCNSGANAIGKILASNGAVVTLATGVSNVSCIAVDATDNLFYGVRGLSTITEIPANGGNNIAVGSGFGEVMSINIDAKGNIFAADRQYPGYRGEKNSSLWI